MSYKDTQGYKDLYNQILQKGAGAGWDSNNTSSKLDQYHSQFANLYQNLVGAAPTDEDSAKFFSTVGNDVLNSDAGFSRTTSTDLSNQTKGFISDTFQGKAQDVAQQQLQAQQGQAQSLADLYRSQGREAISSVEGQLQDYQSRLFDKLRPQLMTSLQSQGLLNTGGLNEAFAGQAKDLAANTSQYLTDARLANENQANAISYGGAAAPYLYKQNQITNQVPYLQGQGLNALNYNNNLAMSNLQYNQNLGLMAYQNKLQQDAQPGLLGRLGQSFVTSVGTNAGSNLSGPAWASALNGGGSKPPNKGM